MKTTVHDIQQGSDAWLAFRSEHFGASECAAMLGLSAHMTRSELLRFKHTGIAREFSDWVQEHILNEGHRAEAAIRDHVERLIGDDLCAVTCSKPETKLSASCDGLTVAGDTAWENKQWNAALADSVAAGVVPDDHMPQCQQILLVTAAQRVIFTVTDGTPDKFVQTEVRPDPAWFERIQQGWAQFDEDLKTYVPPERAPIVTATPMETLPAVSVRMDGTLAIRSNLDAFALALKAYVERIPKAPSTDTEFATCEAACKALKTAEEALDAAETNALASMGDVEAMRRAVATCRDLARTTRLANEKMVAARKAQIREDEVRRGRDEFNAFFKAECERLGGPFIPPLNPDFAGAIKGLKTLDSVRDKINTLVANSKIAVSADAARAAANLKAIDAAGAATLFPDRAALASTRAPDYVAMVIEQRLAAEARRVDGERERIRAEEASRLERERIVAEAQSKRAAEIAEIEAARQREQERTESALLGTPGPYAGNVAQAAQATPSGARDGAHAEQCAPVSFSPPDTPPTLRLGVIADRLGMGITEGFLTLMGFEPAARDKSARLYHEAEFPRMCAAIAEHCLKVGGAA